MEQKSVILLKLRITSSKVNMPANVLTINVGVDTNHNSFYWVNIKAD